MSDTTYTGDVSPTQAWDALKSGSNSVLVDVRTVPEWRLVGQPNLTELDKTVVSTQWQVFPAMEVNENFVEDLAQSGISKDQHIYFLCRSGVRSISAAVAMTAAGYQFCYNIIDGFEGPPNENQQRGQTGGWKAEGLPWSQS